MSAEQRPRQKLQVVVLTAWSHVEGTYHFLPELRLSDALNAQTSPHLRYLPLTDVIVRHLETGKEVLRSNFIMIPHSQINAIMPASEVADLQEQDTDQVLRSTAELVQQMNDVLGGSA